VHSIKGDVLESAKFFDADSIVAPWLDSHEIPERLTSHLDGRAIWDAIQTLKNSVSQVSFGLVHTDYWMGNVLWQGDKITGVIDWEMASYGDPAIDVAYCRMDMRMTGLEEASGHFLDAYQAATDRQVENLEL